MGGAPVFLSVGELSSFGSFAILGLPLALQDSKDNSVSVSLLSIALGVWMVAARLPGCTGMGPVGSAIVLLIGFGLSLFMPGGLGEGDVVFMAGMASIFSFWEFVIALLLGCVAALACYAWLARGRHADALRRPLPLLPSLFWGGLAVFAGGWMT